MTKPKLNIYTMVFVIGFTLLALGIYCVGQVLVATWNYQMSQAPPYTDYTPLWHMAAAMVPTIIGAVFTFGWEKVGDWIYFQLSKTERKKEK